MANSRKTQPVFPLSGDISPEIKAYLQQLHNDLYPKGIVYSSANAPAMTGVNGDVTGGAVRQGRSWSFSLTITGSPSTSVSGTVTLPFIAANTAVFSVSFGGVNHPATVLMGSSTLNLPDWSTSNDVIIWGKADE